MVLVNMTTHQIQVKPQNLIRNILENFSIIFHIFSYNYQLWMLVRNTCCGHLIQAIQTNAIITQCTQNGQNSNGILSILSAVRLNRKMKNDTSFEHPRPLPLQKLYFSLSTVTKRRLCFLHLKQMVRAIRKKVILSWWDYLPLQNYLLGFCLLPFLSFCSHKT